MVVIKLLNHYITSVKLKSQISIILLVFLLLPSVIITILGYTIVEKNLIHNQKNEIREKTYQTKSQALLVINSCKQSANAILQNRELVADFSALCTNKKNNAFTTETFVKEHIDQVNQIMKSNPNLWNIRIYGNNVTPDCSPYLLNINSMKKQSWYTEPFSAKNAWKFGYGDEKLSPDESNQIAILLNEIVNDDNKVIGYLEISVSLNSLFSDMYHSKEDDWIGFVDSAGALHHDRKTPENKWNSMTGTIVFNSMYASSEYSNKIISSGNYDILASSVTLPEISGHIIRAEILNGKVSLISNLKYITILLLIAVHVIFIFIVNKMISLKFKRFDDLVNINNELERGNLNISVPNMGSDEIGVFALQFQNMIDKVQVILKKSVDRELLVKNSEIRSLQNQINAHFIYNVLESIKMMAEIDEKYEISDAVTSLGKLLRYSMKWVSSIVTLREELDYVENYIALINLRYDNKISLYIDVKQDLLDENVPKMSLQPIIENAVYHGIKSTDIESAVIRIIGKEFQTYYTVEITDTGKGMNQESLDYLRNRVYGKIKDDSKKHHGIGLKNVHDRIKICYGNDFGLHFYTKQDCFMKVVIKLPLSRKVVSDGKAVDSRGRKVNSSRTENDCIKSADNNR